MTAFFRSFISILCISSFVFCLYPNALAGQQNGRSGKIQGGVYNVASGDLLVKAGVEVVGTGLTTETGVDGTYSLNLEPGTYTVRFFKQGFKDQTIENVTVAAGQATDLDTTISPVGYELGESVEVKAENTNQLTAALEDRKSATTISDTLSQREISQDTASSAAGVLQRVPGITLVDRFVFVRGLGERYSNTSMNDSVLPTTQPDRKVVPMDLVPANLLQSVKILKTFTPDQPGEFSGGLVKLETIDLPKAASLTASYSLGFNSQTHGEDFLAYPGGGRRDFFGFGRSARELPAAIPENERAVRGNIFLPGGFTAAQLQALGQSFENVWDPRVEDARPNQRWSVSGGNAFGKFGLVGALSFKNDLESRDERRIFYRVGSAGSITPRNDYDYTSSVELARLGLVLNTSYKINGNHQIFFKNFLTNQATDETRIFQGFNDDRRTDLLNTRLRYIEERIYTGQVSGTHILPWFKDNVFAWRYTFSRATLDEPDLRESLYELDPTTGEFIYFNQTQSLFRLFNEMRENIREPAADLSKYWFFSGFSLNTKAGFSLIDRDRVFDSRRFRFAPRSVVGVDFTQRPEQLLQSENINPDLFEIREETRTTDHFDAIHNISAYYLMADFTMKRWRFIGGARVEYSDQVVQTFEPFRVTSDSSFAKLKDRDVLPSFGVAYALKNGEMNLRAGASRTVTRPQFRELSPFEFTDVTGGFSVVGSPGLVRTLLTNYDVRWEWFFSTNQLLALSVFHKEIDNPIETVIEPTAQLRKSFRNADSARNTGFEIETRKNLGDLWQWLENVSINANYTYVRSDVQIGEQTLVVLTTLDRALVGQAENVFNLVLNHELPRYSFEWRALFNYTGEYIIDVGALGLPDITKHGRPQLDMLFSKGFGTENRLRAEFTMKNLLNRQVDLREGSLPFQVYRNGREYSFGVSYRFF
ncbi:MAG: outer membrane beta-barrel protein [Blastocatellia bacterium]|nr:outer membrane beta-barrel protein [Blastocatellia bacterium]